MPGLAAAAETTSAARAEGDQPADAGDGRAIVVTGRDLRGAVATDVPPLVEIDESQIAALAASTIGELLELLSGAAGNSPLVLVNGQRVASLASIDAFPPEAVRRIEILPEELARHYGFPGDRKVLNLILRDRFGAVTAEGRLGAATDGGRGLNRGDLGYARVASTRRWSLSGYFERRDGLDESQRSIPRGEGQFRTLLSQSERARLGASWAMETGGGVSFDLAATLDARRSSSRAGRAGPPNDPVALEQSLRSRSLSLAASASGTLGKWSWFGRAAFDHFADRSRFDRVEGGSIAREAARDRTTLAEAEVVLSGDLASLPAGAIYADVALTAGYERTEGTSSLAGAAALSAERKTIGAELGLNLPLLGGELDPGVGSLVGEVRYGFFDPSDFAAIESFSAGFTWRPARPVRLRALWSRAESAPGVNDLAAPLEIIPNVRVYDFVTGQTVDVERLEGGNPLLAPSVERRFAATLSITPLLLPDLRFEASYRRSRASDAVGQVGIPSEEFAAAYPGRFLRDDAGSLLRIDTRPVNFYRRGRDSLVWSLNFSRTYLPPSTDDDPVDAVSRRFDRLRGGGAVLVGVSHTLALRDRLRTFAGSPTIDYLDGSAGANPRHRVSADANFRRSGLGFGAELQWESGSTVRDAPQANGTRGPLRYPSLAKIGLKAFVDLGERLPPEPRYRWAEGLRISFEVDNLFNARRSVRDASGATPRALLPAYLDPEGRSIRLRIRKLF
ncbi:TonB-dependent receptor domain-containing protein [Qipengyuania sp.]|uniref:TonB-dependent receptor domain-containing protein n=1 Tax=Qipengyuania sp. TaxID=2004515 RepID=UPI003511D829